MSNNFDDDNLGFDDMFNSMGEFERIERYASGEATDAEKEWVENKMAGDPLFKDAVEEQKAIIDALSEHDITGLRQTLKSVEIGNRLRDEIYGPNKNEGKNIIDPMMN